VLILKLVLSLKLKILIQVMVIFVHFLLYFPLSITPQLMHQKLNFYSQRHYLLQFL